MDIIRRNTDYALRIMVAIASSDAMLSAKKLSEQQDVPYQLTCKLLQKLTRASLLKSQMGSKGGFSLAKSPADISLVDVIDVIQGPLTLNRCMLGKDQCPNQPTCPISKKLATLQQHISLFLKDVTLQQLVDSLNS